MTVSGLVHMLEEAHELAMAAMQKKLKLVEAGTALPPGGAEYKGSEDRKKDGQRRKANWEMTKGDAHEASGNGSWEQPGPGIQWQWQLGAWGPSFVLGASRLAARHLAACHLAACHLALAAFHLGCRLPLAGFLW